jgi:hypothetical protein
MLKDYTCLMTQAEQAEIDKHELVYDEALTILNDGKGSRISELVGDLEKVIDLTILELYKNKDVVEKNLILGCSFNFESIYKKYNTIVKALKYSESDPRKLIKKEAEDIEHSFKEYFDYNL